MILVFIDKDTYQNRFCLLQRFEHPKNQVTKVQFSRKFF
jgi:hypothetical protein